MPRNSRVKSDFPNAKDKLSVYIDSICHHLLDRATIVLNKFIGTLLLTKFARKTTKENFNIAATE